MLYRIKMLALTLISITILGVAFAAPATAGSETIVSAYDSQSNDTLVLNVSYTTPECDKKGGGDDVPWFTDLQVTNGASNTDVDISFVPNTGGTLQPGTSTKHRYSSSGPQELTASFTYMFNVEGAESETAYIIISAPSCAGSGVECVLLNFTDPSVGNTDNTYDVGSVITLEASLTGENAGTVKTLVYQTTIDAGPNRTLQDSASREIEFTLDQVGQWRVSPLLKDADGNIVRPNNSEDCVAILDVVAAEDTTPPTTTPPTTTPPTTTPPGPVANPTPVTTVDNNGGVVTSTPQSSPTPSTDNNVLPATSGEAVASANELPATGVHTFKTSLVGLALVMIGFGLVFATKRNKLA